MDNNVLYAQIQNLFLIYLLNNVLTAQKISNLIPRLDSAHGDHIIQTSHLLITGRKMVHQSLSHKDNFYHVLLKNLTIMEKNAKHVSCLNIGASRKMLVFNVLLELSLILMITNVKNLKLMILLFYKGPDGSLMTAI